MCQTAKKPSHAEAAQAEVDARMALSLVKREAERNEALQLQVPHRCQAIHHFMP